MCVLRRNWLHLWLSVEKPNAFVYVSIFKLKKAVSHTFFFFFLYYMLKHHEVERVSRVGIRCVNQVNILVRIHWKGDFCTNFQNFLGEKLLCPKLWQLQAQNNIICNRVENSIKHDVMTSFWRSMFQWM